MQQATQRYKHERMARGEYSRKTRKVDARERRRLIDKAVIAEALRNPWQENDHLCGPECGAE